MVYARSSPNEAACGAGGDWRSQLRGFRTTWTEGGGARWGGHFDHDYRVGYTDAIREQREGALTEKSDRVRPEDHVFSSWHGTPYKEIRRSWDLAPGAAGLAGREGLTPHSLRDSFATHILQNGRAVTDVQQLGKGKLAATPPASCLRGGGLP